MYIRIITGSLHVSAENVRIRCAGWRLSLMTKTLEKYKKYPGGFGNRLRNSINFKRKVLSSMTEDVLS